ncbi:uncharacterized protein LOC144712480 [Wolffia australiana]
MTSNEEAPTNGDNDGDNNGMACVIAVSMRVTEATIVRQPSGTQVARQEDAAMAGRGAMVAHGGGSRAQCQQAAGGCGIDGRPRLRLQWRQWLRAAMATAGGLAAAGGHRGGWRSRGYDPRGEEEEGRKEGRKKERREGEEIGGVASLPRAPLPFLRVDRTRRTAAGVPGLHSASPALSPLYPLSRAPRYVPLTVPLPLTVNRPARAPYPFQQSSRPPSKPSVSSSSPGPATSPRRVSSGPRHPGTSSAVSIAHPRSQGAPSLCLRAVSPRHTRRIAPVVQQPSCPPRQQEFTVVLRSPRLCDSSAAPLRRTCRIRPRYCARRDSPAAPCPYARACHAPPHALCHATAAEIPNTGTLAPAESWNRRSPPNPLDACEAPIEPPHETKTITLGTPTRRRKKGGHLWLVYMLKMGEIGGERVRKGHIHNYF